MITQELYDKGMRCRGSGFNCGGCNDKDKCVDYKHTPFQDMHSQRQDSLNDQMHDLILLAEKNGMYDAADYLKNVFEK